MLNFFTGAGLYLSGNSIGSNQEFLNFYSNTKSVSSFYPSFSATSVEDYTVFDEGSTLEFYLPETLLKGDYNIIFCNEAGYAKSSDEGYIVKVI